MTRAERLVCIAIALMVFFLGFAVLCTGVAGGAYLLWANLDSGDDGVTPGPDSALVQSVARALRADPAEGRQYGALYVELARRLDGTEYVGKDGADRFRQLVKLTFDRAELSGATAPVIKEYVDPVLPYRGELTRDQARKSAAVIKSIGEACFLVAERAKR